MKKIISLLLVLSALMLAFSACGETDTGVPDGMMLVENDKQTYKLFVPENWIVNLTDGVSGAYVSSDNSNISLMIMTASHNYQSLESFCQKYYKDMEAKFKNVSAREEYTENQKFGQLPALKYVFTIGAEASEEEPNAEQYKYMQIFALDQSSNQVYIFTYTALADNYATHLDDVNRIVSEFIH
jgi:hypothetical protein